MNLFILIVKIILVLFFLVMFLRSNKLVWGIGLLTVTTAILLDTLLSTFSREEILTQLGFFFYVIAGGLFAGAAAWLWGILAPQIRGAGSGSPTPVQDTMIEDFAADLVTVAAPAQGDTAYDRRMLFEQMRERLSPDDLLDVVYDLNWSENEVITFGQGGNYLITSIIGRAERLGQVRDLTLAVERILTPIPKENLPRREKLSVDSPPAILRYYLLANYSLADLQRMADDLGIDWEEVGGDNKKTKTRNLLLHLARRNQLGELIDTLQAYEPTS